MDDRPPDPPWPRGPGALAALLRAFDWNATPLGAAARWPEPLRVLVEMMLADPRPVGLVVGAAARILLYNDAAARELGSRHPDMLGNRLPGHAAEAPDPSPLDRAFEGATVALDGRALDLGDAGAPPRDLLLVPAIDAAGVTFAVQVTATASAGALVETAECDRLRRALGESEARSAVLARIAAEATWELGPAGLGDTAAVGDWQSRVHPDDHAEVARRWAEAVAGGRVLDVEFRARKPDTPDGDWRWVHARAAPLLGPDGAVRKWIGISLDVHDERVAECALRAEGDRFRALADAAPVLLWETGPDGLLFVNAQYLSFFGVPLDELRGLGWARFCHPDDHDTYLETFRAAIAAGAPVDALCRFRRADGAWRWLRNTGHPRGEGRQVGCSIDVTELHESQIHQRRSEESLRLVLEGIGEVFYVLDADFRFLFASRSALRLWNRAREEVIGRSFLECFPAAAASGSWAAHLRVHAEGGHLRYETLSPILGIWIEVDITRTTAGGLSVAFRDIDARKRDTAILEGINRIFREALTTRSEDELGRLCLAVAEEVTGSAYGFLGETDEAAGLFDQLAVSDRGWAAFAMDDPAFPLGVPPTGLRIHGLYGRVLSSGRSLIANDARGHPDRVGIPPGHPSIESFLGVPLERNGRVAGMIGLANRPGGFRDEDRQAVERLAPAIMQALVGKRTAASLRTSEERLRSFGEASQDILWIRDAVTLRWTYLTPAFERIFGIARADILRGDDFVNWLDTILPEDREDAHANMLRVLAGETVSFDYRVRRPGDGRVRWLRNTDFPIRDDAGRITHVAGIGHDATDLREVQEQLRVLMRGIPQLLWRALDDGQWTWCSPQWSAFTGQSLSQCRGLGWLDAIHPDDREAALAAWRIAGPARAYQAELRIRNAATDAHRWFRVRATPAEHPTGEIVEWLGTCTDVDDLRELQDRQRVLVGELQHRTRNLMAVIRAVADRTMRTSPGIEDFREDFGARLDALARVQSLLSRLDDHDRVTFDELIRAELAAHGGLDELAGRVDLEGPDGVRLRSGMVQTLAMALHELATNAVKYGALRHDPAAAGAHLRVAWRLGPPPDRPDAAAAPWLHIRWEETGIAVDSQARDRRRTGQGRALIERALPYQLGARTAYALLGDRLECDIIVPISAAMRDGQDA